MLALLICIVITVADQATKQLVRMNMPYGRSHVVIPGLFDLIHLRNTGAAWGMLGGRNVFLTGLSIIMLAALMIFRRRLLSDSRLHRIALGLMLGGILGNLLDRLREGWVTDFLDFYVAGHHWPAFNIADAAICLGVGIYVLTSWRKDESRSLRESREMRSDEPGAMDKGQNDGAQLDSGTHAHGEG